MLQQVNSLIQDRNWHIQAHYKHLVKKAQPKTSEEVNDPKKAVITEYQHKKHEEEVDQVSRNIVQLELDVEQLKEQAQQIKFKLAQLVKEHAELIK